MNASAVIANGKVVCSRCGSRMKAEQFWHEDNQGVPMILWRCPTGHLTQAIPLPIRIAAIAALTPRPRI